MFTSIVWATDGSPAADAALPYVESLAASPDAKVTVVHADQHFLGRGGGYSALADEPELRTKIRAQTEALVAKGIDATFVAVVGTTEKTGDLIADAAKDAEADVIVVGSRGHGALASAVIGSVTTRLLHVAPCPVLAVPARVAATAAV